MEFDKIIDYVEENKQEYLEKELNDNKRKLLRKKLLERSIEKNKEVLKRLSES